MTTVKNIYDYINSIAPYDSQEEWDNSGHLVGDFRKEVKKVVMSLDCTKMTVEYAKSINADMVLTHHPVIFSSLNSVKSDTALYNLIENDIACVCAHTNFDKADNGINHNLASLLGLSDITDTSCDFITVGTLENEMSIDDFAHFVSQTLDVQGIRYTDTDKIIKKVAVGGGACSEFIDIALENADCFVTGDLKYHEMLDASENGQAVISAGHFETENLPFLMLKNQLEKIFTDVEFYISPQSNPIKTIID